MKKSSKAAFFCRSSWSTRNPNPGHFQSKSDFSEKLRGLILLKHTKKKVIFSRNLWLTSIFAWLTCLWQTFFVHQRELKGGSGWRCSLELIKASDRKETEILFYLLKCALKKTHIVQKSPPLRVFATCSEVSARTPAGGCFRGVPSQLRKVSENESPRNLMQLVDKHIWISLHSISCSSQYFLMQLALRQCFLAIPWLANLNNIFFQFQVVLHSNPIPLKLK